MALRRWRFAHWRVADQPPHWSEGEALMGWLILLLLFIMSLGLLWQLGVRGGLLTACAAACWSARRAMRCGTAR